MFDMFSERNYKKIVVSFFFAMVNQEYFDFNFLHMFIRPNLKFAPVIIAQLFTVLPPKGCHFTPLTSFSNENLETLIKAIQQKKMVFSENIVFIGYWSKVVNSDLNKGLWNLRITRLFEVFRHYVKLFSLLWIEIKISNILVLSNYFSGFLLEFLSFFLGGGRGRQ